MADRPIIFSGGMVKALLAGTKTQTRRILKKQDWPEGVVRQHPHQTAGVPYAVGDRLWVREAWAHDAPDLETARARFEDALGGAGYGPYYRATEPAPDTLRWLSPIHMPRWASRLTLTVNEVRVERLQDISEEDARAEGVTIRMETGLLPSRPHEAFPVEDHRGAFRRLWCELHGPASWDASPWVAAISFNTTPANIDSLPEQP